MHRLLVALLPCLFVLAGCISSGSEVPAGTDDDETIPLAGAAKTPASTMPEKPAASSGPPAAPTEQPATTAAGGSSEDATVAAAAPRPTVTDAIDWTRTLGLSQCVDAPTGYSCTFNGPSPTNPLGDGSNILVYQHQRVGQDLAAGELTFTWDATTSPTTAALNVRVFLLYGCPDHCDVAEMLTDITGESPLVVSFSEGHLADGETFGLLVRPAETAPGLYVSLGQDVTMRGELTFYEDAPVAAASVTTTSRGMA